jgi:hypothetical protein
MKTRAIFALAAAAGMATVASAQEGMTFSIKWDKAVVNNGEVQTGSVWATFTPPIGSNTNWNTPPGSGQPGTVEAFASSQGHLLNILNGTAGTLAWTVPSAVNLANKPGTPDGNGGISTTQAGQFGPPANPTPLLDNPIKILDLMWTPSNYSAKTVTYKFDGTSAKLWLDVGLQAWVGENAIITDSGNTSFEVVPAPATLALLGLGGLVAGRRRR